MSYVLVVESLWWASGAGQGWPRGMLGQSIFGGALVQAKVGHQVFWWEL